MPSISDEMDDADFDAAFGGGDDVLPIVLPQMPPMQMPPMQQAPAPRPQQAPPQMQRPQQVPPQMQRPMPQQRPVTPQTLRSLPMPQQRPMPQPPQMQHPMQQMSPYQGSPFVLPLPPGLGTTPEEPFFKRKIGGLPVWAWGLIAAGGGTVAYFAMREKKDATEKKAAKSKTAPKRLEQSRSSDGWSPSRGRFADALEKKFGGKFEKVYDNAEDAVSASFKTVSPLINIKAKAGYKIDKAFESFCKADGLHPVMHDDNEIGLYPADGTARGREWEEYVDALRDDGQTV
jgi:hypothetical protein